MSKKNIDNEIKEIMTILENIGYNIEKTLFEEEVDSVNTICGKTQMQDKVDFQLIIRGFRLK